MARYDFVVCNLENHAEHEVTFTKWNKPNSFVKLTSITVGLAVSYSKLKTLERSIFANNPCDIAKFGLSVNEGKFTIQDEDDELKELYMNRILKDGLNVDIVFNKETIGKFTTKNVSYTAFDKYASIDIVGKLQSLQTELDKGYSLPKTQSEVVTKSALQILSEIYPKEMVIGQATKERLNAVMFTYPLLTGENKYSMLNKLMKATLCVMYENDKGETEVKYIG